MNVEQYVRCARGREVESVSIECHDLLSRGVSRGECQNNTLQGTYIPYSSAAPPPKRRKEEKCLIRHMDTNMCEAKEARQDFEAA